jgi:D-glycero-D-manno-heptose 1,7-bisphosphate phosphatase
MRDVTYRELGQGNGEDGINLCGRVRYMKKQPAVFLERDGVLNVDRGYICLRRELEWIPGAIEAIQLLNERGYYVFVATNQSGIARGFFREEDVYDFHCYMEDEVEKHDAMIHSFYVCPHHPEGRILEYAAVCNCRKPLSGLIGQACQEWAVDLDRSFLIGNHERDLAAANSAGIPGYLFFEENLYDFVLEVLKKQGAWRRHIFSVS